MHLATGCNARPAKSRLIVVYANGARVPGYARVRGAQRAKNSAQVEMLRG
jgi:hypothetical protein